MPDDKLKIPDFAAKIKAKYPEYKDMNDTLLVQKIVDKYPEYAANVDMSGLKKKASSPVVGQQPKEYVSAAQSTSPISYFPSSPFYTPTLEQVRALPDNKPIPAPDLGVQKSAQDNIITGQQRQKVQSIAKNAIDEVQHIKELPKRVEEYKKKKQEVVAKAPVDNFDPQQFLQIDINGDGKDAYNKALGVTEGLKASGVVSTKNIEDAASFKSYFGERIKQLDEKENMLREMLKGQQAKNLDISPTRGDIAGQMGKPIDLQGVVKNETPLNEQEISDALNTLKEYRANLYKTADYYAKKLAKKVVPQGNNKDLGKAYGEIMNDPYSQELNRFEQKGIPIRDEDKLNQDLQGLEVRKDDLEERYQGKEKDDAYYNELYQIEQGQKDAIHKYPELKRQRIALLITQELGKDAEALVTAASSGDERAIKAISDKTGISKKDILSISKGDLPSEGFLGNIGKGIYGAGTGFLTGVNRLVGGAFGADPDRLTYINRKISESGNDIFGDNPYEHTIAPETIVNSDLSLSRNPKAGKYNYNAASIKNLAGEAIGGLLGFVGGTKGLGYLGMGERAALWTNVIASGYENRYQQAAQVLGKDASEKSKNQFALITGAIEAAAFEFLPKEKLGLNLTKKEVQEFGDIVGKTSINNINKEALTKWTEKVLQGTLKSAGEAGKVTAAMSASKIVNGILRQQLGDKNGFDEAAGILDPHKLGEEFLGLMLPLSLAEIPQGMKHSRQFKESLYDAGNNADVYRTQIKQAVQLGRMPEKEGELRLKTLDALQNISSTVPETNPETNQPLTHSQKVEYTYNRVKESAIQSKKEGIKGDEALAQLYNKNAKELVDERKSILNGTQAEYQKITELYDRVKEKESHNKTLATGTKTEGIKYLSEQALTTPNSIKNTLKGDADLTTDLIAQNEPFKIKEEISKLKEKHAKLTDQEKYEEADALDKHITLLEEGLKKAKAEPPPLDIEHEGVIVTSPTEGGNITEVSAPNEIQKANENGLTIEPPLQQPEPITIGANGEEVKPEVTQEPIKPLEPKQTEEVIQPETKVSEGGGGAAEPPKEEVEGNDIYVEPKRTELSFKGLQEIATQFGYNDITSRERKSDLKLFNDAKETIQKWMDEGIYSKKIDETVNKITHTDEERVILENHLHSMRMEADEAAAKFGVNSPDFKKLSSELDDFVLKMKAARSEQAAGLRIPSTANMNTASIADAINAYKASQNGADLTEKQTEEVAKDYDNIKQAKEKAEAVFKEANAKFEEMKAENQLLKQQLAAKKSKTNKIYTKDGKRDYKSERNSLKEQLKKQAQEFIDESKKLGIADDGGAKQFLMSAKIAKTVLEIAKSHAEEVGAKLSEVVKKTLDDVKDFISGISEEDIRDVISGKYSEKKYTRNEITAIMRELKTEQQLLNEYERLLSGGEPKEEKKKIQRNERLQALRDKIKSFSSDKGEPTDEMIKKAKDAISRNKAKEQKFSDKLKNENYEKEKSPQSIYDSPEFKKKYPDLYKDLLDSRQKAHEAQLEFEKKLVQNEMKNATTFDKFKQVLLKSRGTLKAIFAGIDDSAVGVQNWMMALTNPHIGGQSIKNHFLDFWSQSRFDRYIQELHNSSDWNIMKESGLRVSEPKSLLEEGRDEMFPQRFKAILKIKGKEYGYVNIGGKKYELFDVLKPFERAFTSLGNSLRVIKFRTDAEKLYEKGYTFENNPDAFKKLATRINNMTSAPEINPKFQSDLLNVAIWSPRLLTSKLNILGISDIASVTPLVDKGYYRSLGTKGKILSKEQMYAVADLAKFAAAVMAISYGYAAARGGTVNTDPTSNGYLDVELPNGKSYNFSGGFSKYISLISQLARGGKTNKLGVFKPYEKTMTDRAAEVAHFLRGKMPPISGSIVNLATGSDYTGKKTDFATEAERYKMPMAIGQIYDQVQKDGYSSLFIDGIPTFLGINIKDSRDYTSHNFSDETKKFIEKHQIDVTYPSKIYTKHGEKIKMTDDEYKIFLKDTDKAIEEEIADLKKNGDYVIRDGKLSNGKIPYRSLKIDEIKEILKERISDRIQKIREKTFKTEEKNTQDYINEANKEILNSLREANKNR